MGLHQWAVEKIAWPAMEAWKQNRIRAVEAELLKTQYAPKEQLEALQRQRLSQLLRHCREHVPAYQAILEPVSPEEIERDPMAVLNRMPVLTKEDFRSRTADFRADNRPDGIENATGGSTGMPLRFVMDRPQVESYEAARWRGLSWYGISQGTKSVMIWGNRPNVSKFQQKKQAFSEWALKNRITVSAYHLSGETIRQTVDRICRFRPEYLYGYANGLDALASLMLAEHVEWTGKLKAVVSTAEDLLPEAEERIRKVFRCPVVNEYGAKDAGILGYTCPEGHLHLTVENAVFQTLDPVTLAPAEPGQPGVLAVTDLNNYAMPRLRYLLGDVLSISQAPCACGRTLPVCGSLQGREETLLQAADGTLVHGSLVCVMARQYSSISRFQIEQVSPEKAILRLERKGDDRQGAQELQYYLEQALKGVQVEVEDPAQIHPEPSGKYRYAVRRFPLRQKEQ